MNIHIGVNRTTLKKMFSRLLDGTEFGPVVIDEDLHASITLAGEAKLKELAGGTRCKTSVVGIDGTPAADGKFRVLILNCKQGISLSTIVPVLESTGLVVLSENALNLNVGKDRHSVFLHDLEVEYADNKADLERNNQEELCRLIEDCIAGLFPVDGFNGLLLCAGLSARQIGVIRAYFQYFKQLGQPYTLEHVQKIVKQHIGFIQSFSKLFDSKFDPQAENEDRKATCAAHYSRALDELVQVESAQDEKVLSYFLNLLEATLRTNFYQKNDLGQFKDYISLKFDCANITYMPRPKPKYEIFVFSGHVEGVHLRGGKVARGGLRWSDRVDDYRTEILGLVKAQMVKNAVIVPDGAKGGFIVKQTKARAQSNWFEYGQKCYQTFISGLLDITDNIVDGKVHHPLDVVIHDDDDPYLVVAADKGTATFSDLANEVSEKYGFWLGDGFASGGSYGYDHKKMGITAKGAWEAVKRHFRETGLDTQNDKFSVVGVGDMSGDVFGNGMLLSRKIQLLAAFDHRHIFIDPNPDCETSWLERKRLFDKGRSSWADYDMGLLSTGGAVLDRSAKKVHVSEEARQALNLTQKSYQPDDLISELLTASVDLLWFGGIGTYIRASSENDNDVGDRANDSVRIAANQLNCRVVGEGANLALTQKGRVEYALKGGRINTDAIDNAAGVNCSDHEVNIKILLQQAVSNGSITNAERNQILEDMTAEVSQLVLRDNYLQTQALSFSERMAFEKLDRHIRLMNVLEKGQRGAFLDREIENLPDDEEMSVRRNSGRGLSRPELAVLLSYTKIAVFKELLNSDFPDQESLSHKLISYFPEQLQRQFGGLILEHPLRREIITTKVVNSMINRVGSGFINDMQDYVGCEDKDVATAYATLCDVFDLIALWQKIEGCDLKVPANVQVKLMMQINRLVEQGTQWLLLKQSTAKSTDVFSWAQNQRVDRISVNLVQKLCGIDKELFDAEVEEYSFQGVPLVIAERVASCRFLVAVFALAEIAENTDWNVEEIVERYFAIGEDFSLNVLREEALSLAHGAERWERGALHAVAAEYGLFQAKLTRLALENEGEVNQGLGILRTRLEELRMSETANLATLSVAAAAFRQFI